MATGYPRGQCRYRTFPLPWKGLNSAVFGDELSALALPPPWKISLCPLLGRFLFTDHSSPSLFFFFFFFLVGQQNALSEPNIMSARISQWKL